MIGLAEQVILWLVGVVIIVCVIKAAFWVLAKIGVIIPPPIEMCVWIVVGLLAVYYALLLVGGGSVPFHFGGRSELSTPQSSARLAARSEATGRYLQRMLT